jgi:hypothetical protein
MVGPTLEELKEFIQTDEVVNAAITEAIHRFYHHRCFSPYTLRPFDTEEVKAISKIHSIFTCKYAGWRHTTLCRQVQLYSKMG